jgi:hypothetical protein
MIGFGPSPNPLGLCLVPASSDALSPVLPSDRWGAGESPFAVLMAILLDSTRMTLASAASQKQQVAYGGLAFQVPRSWHVETVAQTEPCGAALPAVIVGPTAAPKHYRPSCLHPAIRTGTEMKILPAGETGGCSSDEGLTPSDTVGSQTYRHDGIEIKVDSDQVADPRVQIAWTLTACFSHYPKVVVMADATGTSNADALALAVGIVRTAAPEGHH